MSQKAKEIIRVIIATAALIFLFYPYFTGNGHYLVAFGVIIIVGICITAVSLGYNVFNQKNSNKAISELRTINVYMLNLVEVTKLIWEIGQDISEENCAKFLDEETGYIYAMTAYEKGNPIITLMKKDFWEYAALHLGVSTGISHDEASAIKEKFDKIIEERKNDPK